MTIEIPGNRDETLIFATEHFIKTAYDAISERGAFHVALSGGSTPKAIFHLLSEPPYAKQINWTKVHLYWSDERCVPPDHPDSNYKMAMDAGLSTLPIEHIHRMEGELDPQLAAKHYQELIHDLTFDLVMLGMGDDGHTASLFPHTAALTETKLYAVANEIPGKGWRLTLTYPCINSARQIVFYVLGASKQEALMKVLTTKDYPASHIENPLWICDLDSAKLLG